LCCALMCSAEIFFLTGVPLLLLFFFSLGQERELSDVSE
jgi:hypothetical protein